MGNSREVKTHLRRNRLSAGDSPRSPQSVEPQVALLESCSQPTDTRVRRREPPREDAVTTKKQKIRAAAAGKEIPAKPKPKKKTSRGK